MTFQKNLTALVVILAILFAAIGALYSYKIENDSISYDVKTTDSLIEVYSEVEVHSTRAVVTDRYLTGISSDSTVVVAGADGSLNSVRGGSVLTGGNVISVDTGSTSVYNIANPEKSVETN